MGWVKLTKYNFVNVDRITDVMMLKNRDGSHYIKFLINGNDWRTSKCFDQLKRCEEYKVDWNLHEESGYLVNNKKRVYDFWEKYPDSIIVFG